MGERIGILTKGPFDTEPVEQLVDTLCTKGGLAVHAYPPDLVNNWTVTHIPSGLRIASRGASPDDALAVLQELDPLVDWSLEEEDLAPILHAKQQELTAIILRHGMTRGSR